MKTSREHEDCQTARGDPDSIKTPGQQEDSRQPEDNLKNVDGMKARESRKTTDKVKTYGSREDF